MKFASRLFAHYRSYHQHGPMMLRYLGIVGFLGFPAYYLLRFTKTTTTYDDWPFRLLDAALCLVLFFKDRWPERFKPYYFAYSYAVLIVTLPLTFVFTSLKNGGGTVAVGNTLMAVFLVILLTDWRNMIVMLVTGFAAAVGLYVLTDPNPEFPMDYVQRIPILLVVMVAGSLFKTAAERATAERVRNAYASLAGSIAHEMRNPLGQLKHSLESMQQALPAPTTSARPHTLDAAAVDALYNHLAQSEVAVKRGLQVIDMTLDEVSARPMDTEGFSHLLAGEATRKAVREYAFESEADRAKVSVEVVGDFVFRGDETAYLFVLFNLIKNALYYLSVNPAARVTITVARNEVRVHDTGPGIAPDLLGRLFEPFNSAGKSGGTGLGLAYCRRVMHAFGGEIQCESVLRDHTQFTLSFPPVSARESEAHRQRVLDNARAAFAGKRVLVVDDDAAQRMISRHKLLPLGAEVDQAADGQGALEALAKSHYDLVLLDLNMPVLDGYAVAERIRHGVPGVNRDVRIVAYTSEPAHLAGVKTHKAGMDGFVSKPCAQLPLLEALHRALLRPAHVDSAGDALAGRRYLLADDSPHNRKAVAAFLKHAGAEVVEANDGAAVLKQLQGDGPWDAVLMDINMPGMSGLETAQLVRASVTAWRDVPIIALTAHSDEGTVHAAQAAGMNGFLTKPVDAAVLYARLGELREIAVAHRGEPLQPTPSALAWDAKAPLLNPQRLESYRRIGMLEELLQDYIPELARLVQRLEQAVGRRDLQASLDTLHSLLGMSGEAGAPALYQAVRTVYVPMLEARSWPAGEAWVDHIKTLAAHTEQALGRYGPPQPAVSAD